MSYANYYANYYPSNAHYLNSQMLHQSSFLYPHIYNQQQQQQSYPDARNYQQQENNLIKGEVQGAEAAGETSPADNAGVWRPY
jgi:hypothetical protein